MNGTESSAVTPLQTDWVRHGLNLCLMGLALFASLGLTGLVLQRVAASASGPEVSASSRGVAGLEPIVLAWTASEALEPAHGSLTAGESQDSSPLALVAGSLSNLKLTSGSDDWLVLEPDGSLRTEGEGALVGFLHGGLALTIGDKLPGPGLMSFHLLHHDAWCSDDVLIPIVESDGAGAWIVIEQRRFEVRVSRQPQPARSTEAGELKLHSRTGLPTVSLASKGA